MPDDEPLVRWDWIHDHLGYLGGLARDHAVLSLVPVLIGLLLALPLGLVGARFPRLYQPLAVVFNTLYAMPALALFMLLVPYTGLGSLGTVMIPLTFYALALLLPTVVEGIRSTPEPVRQAAVALGYGPGAGWPPSNSRPRCPTWWPGCGWPRSPASRWRRSAR